MIEAYGLIKAYGDQVVLTVPQLTITPGAITAIVGPSGAGKSTLLRLLAGLEAPDRGCLTLNGKPCNGAELRRYASLVLQHPIAFRGTVLYNASLAPRLLGASRREARSLGLEALAQVGLAGLAHQDARTLSGGELVRLSLARALAKGPELLLLDEATSNLDPANVGNIEALLRGLLPRTTIVMVTHNLPQARRLSQSTAVLLNNTLIAQGPTKDLFTTAHGVVAAFLRGDMIY